LIFIFSLKFIYILYIYNSSNNKVCLCTIGKNENKYVREFVEYYKNYGFDNIIIYDNNDIDGENFDIVLNDYIKNGYVKIINYRGKAKTQNSMLNNCYNENNHLYDWLIFYDFDEFIHLSKYNNIKKYLGKARFKKCNVIYLNQVLHTDNDQVFYTNKSLFQRFPYFTTNFNKKIGYTKIIIRGNLTNINFTNPHVLDYNNQCNSIGKLTDLSYIDLYNEYYHSHHFYFKSTEEYFNKLKRGGVTSGKKYFFPDIFDFYFSVNRITKEKIDYLENRSGLNLSRYKDKLIE